jgi:hypothetical protein
MGFSDGAMMFEWYCLLLTNRYGSSTFTWNLFMPSQILSLGKEDMPEQQLTIHPGLRDSQSYALTWQPHSSDLKKHV